MRASSSTTTMRSGRVLAGVFICNSTYVTAAILPGENPCQGGKPTLCYIYFWLCLRFRDVEHGRLVRAAACRVTAHCKAYKRTEVRVDEKGVLQGIDVCWCRLCTDPGHRAAAS